MKTIMVTGGAGFIGSAVIRYIINDTSYKVINVDKLTYAGNLESLKEIATNERYTFEHVDICNAIEIKRLFDNYQPDIIMHLAAESHVDRSIDEPNEFIQTNIVGTYVLLQQARFYWMALEGIKKSNFRFLHMSTDEVYGDLPHPADVKILRAEPLPKFSETTPYAPSSPYAASKASSDHLVQSWQRTYGLPTLIIHSTNSYGPYHYPEKLIPLMILNALDGKVLPIYGKGNQIRDWIYVVDLAKALMLVATQGKVSETYNIGSHNEKQNIEVVMLICELLEELVPEKPKGVQQYKDLISFVKDRAGHDKRYAIDANKISQELGWKPLENFKSGLKKTINWYLANKEWCERAQNGFQRERLGNY